MGNVGDIWMRSHLPILFLGVLSYQRFPRRLPILLTAHPHALSSQPWLVRKAHWLSLTPAATFEFARSKMMDVTKNCIIYNINIYIYICTYIYIYIYVYTYKILHIYLSMMHLSYYRNHRATPCSWHAPRSASWDSPRPPGAIRRSRGAGSPSSWWNSPFSW